MAVVEKPTGLCPRCGLYLDDHNGWLMKAGPQCPAPKPKETG